MTVGSDRRVFFEPSARHQIATGTVILLSIIIIIIITIITVIIITIIIITR